MPMYRWIAVALSGLLALAITDTPASAQKPGGTLVQITQPEPPNLAPYISTSAPIGQVTSKVYEGLLEYGFDLKPKPSLAESWEVAPDGGARHDGRRAADVSVLPKLLRRQGARSSPAHDLHNRWTTCTARTASSTQTPISRTSW